MRTDSIEIQLSDIMDEYSEEVQEVTSETIQRIANETVQTLKSTSPKKPGGGAYARGWAVKRADYGTVTGVIVYNRTNGQLTHLLENGHIIRNQSGTYGRTQAIPHIKPAEEQATRELMNELEKNL